MGLYDEVEIEDMDWDQELHGYTYSCPCGDLFQITVVCSPGPQSDFWGFAAARRSRGRVLLYGKEMAGACRHMAG